MLDLEATYTEEPAQDGERQLTLRRSGGTLNLFDREGGGLSVHVKLPLSS